MMVCHRGEYAGAVAILFLVLTWVVVSLRIYVRAILMKAFGKDDYLMVVSLVSLVKGSRMDKADGFKALFSFYCGFVIVGVEYGTGRHVQDIMEEPDGQANFVFAMKVGRFLWNKGPIANNSRHGGSQNWHTYRAPQYSRSALDFSSFESA